MSPTERRVAVVTGAGGVLGASISRALAEDGHHVILVDRSELVAGQAKAFAEAGLLASGWVADVANEDEVFKLGKNVRQVFARADIVVNCAGVMLYRDGDICRIEGMSLSHWNTVMTVNLTAVFLMCREFLPLMKARSWGRIVNITSRVARSYVPGVGADYAASKAGLTGFTRILAGETAKSGITANCVAPGRVSSSMGGVVGKDKDDAANRRVPMGRAGTPEEVASAVSYLVSERAAYVTGATVDVNGGGFMP